MSSPPATICVFCGSQPGVSPAHMAAARSLAQIFAKRGIRLVYGGGTIGLMGELARTLVSLSGPDSVQGVIPDALLRYEGKFLVTAADLDEMKDGKAPINGEMVTIEKKKAHYLDENKYGRTTIVPDMHTRKALMAKLVRQGGPGSGFIALSGGYGTLEELMEVVTWNQLGIHEKGVCVLNVDGYWDGILKWVETAVASGFVTKGNGGIMVEAKSPEEAVEMLGCYRNSKERYNLKLGEK